MYNSEKTSNFLKAIDKYAKQQQIKMLEELKEIEKREIEKAEASIMEDVRNMVQRELVSMKNRIAVDISHKELEERKKLARKRQCIMKDVFTLCREKLLEFRNTHEYTDFLKGCVKGIAEVLKYDDTKLYIMREDEKYVDLIKENFGMKCDILYSNDISIGGIYGFSEKANIIADETIDSRLCEQKEWFKENYGIQLI